MFELALKILSAISFQGFKGEVDIVVNLHKAVIHITPPLSAERITQIPDNAKDHCKVITDTETTVITVSL